MNSSQRIVPLGDRPQDLPVLAAWQHDQWGRYYPGDTPGARAARLEAHLTPGIPTTFVAVCGDELLGSAALVEHDMNDRPELTPWLASVYVHPAHRRRGIASALVGRVVAEARSLGVATLYLYTPDQECLYSRLGWWEFERRRYLGEDVVIMTWPACLALR